MWKDYFDFTWSERIAIRILLIILLLLVIWRVYRLGDTNQIPGDYAELRSAITAFEDSLKQEEQLLLAQADASKSRFYDTSEDKNNDHSNAESDKQNTGTNTDFSSKKSDNEQHIKDFTNHSEPNYKKDEISEHIKSNKKEYNFVELNQCKDEDLQQLPGIAAVLSKRILAYRDKLGGFYESRQLLEVYGLKPETYSMIEEYIHVDAASVKQLSINFAGRDELAKHPYIGKTLSSKILEYRSKTGFISSLQQLASDSICSDSELRRLAPYLKID